MKKSKNLTIIASIMIVAGFVSAVAPLDVGAANQCGDTETYFNWGCSGTGEQITPLFLTIFNWLAVGVSIAVVAGIIYGAILYTTSGGAQDRAKKGIDTIRNAVIALILYFAMFSLLNFLVPGGLFS